jgi:RNA-directed DNA polymerase
MIFHTGPAPLERGTFRFSLISMNSSSMLIARVVLSGPFTEVAITSVLGQLRGGRETRAISILARALVKVLGEGQRPRLRAVAKVLSSKPSFCRLVGVLASLTELAELPPPSMQPATGAPEQWCLPALNNVTALADWLGLDFPTLHWLSAAWRSDHEMGLPMQHYRYRWVPRKGSPPRLLEAPLPKLKSVQQQILRGILEHIPTHPAAHGFIKGRGIVSFATPHTGQRCVLRMDLQDFFPSIHRGRVLRVFLTAGYPEAVASILANLCTVVTPALVRQAGLSGVPLAVAWPLQALLRNRHLPQGAPTSPALANLCAYALDLRLTGLATKFAAHYTRYADDLLFSGGDDFRRDAQRCEAHVGAVLLEAGFAAAHRKTRRMPCSVAQRAVGLTLNVHAAVPRPERDKLRAILTNCARHGPASQNRNHHPDFRAHLLGRISHAAHVHPTSARKLRLIFDRIVW